MSRTANRRLKLLLITAGCHPAATGEAYVAFQWVSRLARHHDVTLLTYRYSSTPESLSKQLPEARVIEWSDLAIFERWNRFNALLKPGYVLFYRRARRWIKDALRAGERFDLVHQITPNALRYPSPAAGLGIPFIVGPRGGSLNNPKEFLSDFGKVPWYTRFRDLDYWRFRHDPLLRKTYTLANAIIGMAPYVKDLIGGLAPHAQFEFMPDVGIDHLPSTQGCRNAADQFRLLFVGRAIRSKGLRDLVRALAKVKDIKGIHLDVVGAGEDEEACKREAHELGVEDKVVFHGWKLRKEVDPFYANASVFAFPSFREPSSGAVIEAMSYGLPMIVADRGGPGFMVNESCGFRIPVINPDQFATDIAAAIRKLLEQPELRAAMGKAAREKIVREFLWDAKLIRLHRIYDEVLATQTSTRTPVKVRCIPSDLATLRRVSE